VLHHVQEIPVSRACRMYVLSSSNNNDEDVGSKRHAYQRRFSIAR